MACHECLRHTKWFIPVIVSVLLSVGIRFYQQRQFIAMSSKNVVTVHPKTDDPTGVWNEMKGNQVVQIIESVPLNTPISPDKVRFVFMSDTHDNVEFSLWSVPDGDVFLHAGDFTNRGKIEQIERFNNFLGNLPHRHKLVIAGNHELTMDPRAFIDNDYESALTTKWGVDVAETRKYMEDNKLKSLTEMLTNCTYLQDEEITIYGLRIYGTPWQPEFCNMAFNKKRGEECLEKWNLIPDGVDVLMTHGPPLGHGDMNAKGQNQGCVELLATVQNRVKPKYHVFGHIHEGYGITRDGSNITYINASTVDGSKKPVNPPVIFDIPLPEGFTKEAKQKSH